MKNVTIFEKRFLKLFLIIVCTPPLAVSIYMKLVILFDRHPIAPFVSHDRVESLIIASNICGVPGPSLAILPSSFELEFQKIEITCKARLKKIESERK